MRPARAAVRKGLSVCGILQIFGWSENRDALKWMECEKIGISGYDGLSLAIYCQLQELIVFWVSAGMHHIVDGNKFCDADQQLEKASSIFKGYVAVELRTSKNLHEFKHGGFGNE